MNNYETFATVEDAGTINVVGVPFAPGTVVEISIVPKSRIEENATLHDSERLAAARQRMRDLFAPIKAIPLPSQGSNEFSKQVAFDRLAEVFNACRQANWDDEGAEAVDQNALRNALLFIEALPPGFPLPTISAEPDGHIDMEWYRDPRRILSVSVAPEGMLYWAALFDIEDPRGSCPFQGEVPETILHWIARVCA